MLIPDFPVDETFLKGIAELALDMIMRDKARDTSIGSGPVALAERLIVKRSPESSIYVHCWRRSDPDDLHDHPWDFCSIILTVGYWEITPDGSFWRPPGSMVMRKAEERHRVQMDETREERPISLFITGQERRPWGFHTAEGWIEGKRHRSVEEYRKRRHQEGAP